MTRTAEEILSTVDEAMAAGDLSAANRLLQALKRTGQNLPDIEARLAEIARRLGLDKAVPRPAPAYQVIRGWGAGFWADVGHVALQTIFAESQGRIPIVFWGRESRYYQPGAGNAWDLYFEPMSTVPMAEAEAPGLSYFPGKWTGANLRVPRLNKDSGEGSRVSSLYFLSRPEQVLVSDYYTEPDDVFPWLPAGHAWSGIDPEAAFGAFYRERLRLKPPLALPLDSMARQLLKDRPMLAVHYRTQSSLKILESQDRESVGIEAYFPVIDRHLDANRAGGIFAITDFAPAHAALKERYGARVTRRAVSRLTEAGQISLEWQTHIDGRRLAIEVIFDAYLAARCDAFVGDGASGVSNAVCRLKAWPEGTVTLFRRGGVPLGHIRQHSDPSEWWNPPE
jgi:hypothetical protein